MPNARLSYEGRIIEALSALGNAERGETIEHFGKQAAAISDILAPLREDVTRLEWWAEHGYELYSINRDGRIAWVAVWMADESDDDYSRVSAPTFRDAIDAAMKPQAGAA